MNIFNMQTQEPNMPTICKKSNYQYSIRNQKQIKNINHQKKLKFKNTKKKDMSHFQRRN